MYFNIFAHEYILLSNQFHEVPIKNHIAQLEVLIFFI
jgi:hypothetical protein